MRSLRTTLLGLFGALALAAPAMAASPVPAKLDAVEIAVTYANGGVDVFEIASAAKGSLLALPILPGATNIKVGGGQHFLTREGAEGSEAMVQSPSGSAQATYRVAYPPVGDFLFIWRSPAPIARVVLLTGPQVHPSGLGIAPFQLGTEVKIGGKLLTSFNATNVPAGFTLRWPFEIGDPGAWLGNLFLGVAIAVPALALVLGVLRYIRRPRAA